MIRQTDDAAPSAKTAGVSRLSTIISARKMDRSLLFFIMILLKATFSGTLYNRSNWNERI